MQCLSVRKQLENADSPEVAEKVTLWEAKLPLSIIVAFNIKHPCRILIVTIFVINPCHNAADSQSSSSLNRHGSPVDGDTLVGPKAHMRNLLAMPINPPGPPPPPPLI